MIGEHIVEMKATVQPDGRYLFGCRQRGALQFPPDDRQLNVNLTELARIYEWQDGKRSLDDVALSNQVCDWRVYLTTGQWAPVAS